MNFSVACVRSLAFTARLVVQGITEPSMFEGSRLSS